MFEISERIKDERARSARVLIILMRMLHHPCRPAHTLKAASSGEHHTELGADFCLLLTPRHGRNRPLVIRIWNRRKFDLLLNTNTTRKDPTTLLQRLKVFFSVLCCKKPSFTSRLRLRPQWLEHFQTCLIYSPQSHPLHHHFALPIS